MRSMWIFTAFACFCCASLNGQDFKKEVVYQIITDRFFDGDTTNNDPPQSRGMFDPAKTNWQMYWGGDLAGIRDKLPYLQKLGVTTLWISPPIDNSNQPWRGPDGKPVSWFFAPYHGYGARDFKRIDEHFGSARNDWKAFDELVASAHALGMKILVDFSPNDSNLRNTGERGAIYDDGKLLGTYDEDTKKLYHHNGPLQDIRKRYDMQYQDVYDLADFDHMNPLVDRYLKDAVHRFQQHGVDAFRIDAVKHMSWGWAYSLADATHLYKPSFVFAEWFQESIQDSLYSAFLKFSRNSGIPLLDYPLALATRRVFGQDQSFRLIADVLDREDKDFESPNDLLVFADNHDIPRLMSVNGSRRLLDQATAFVLTVRGIPILLYGDEQYLHNDTNEGRDPYTRPWMSSYDEGTTGFRLIQKLAALRKHNDALAYGSMRMLFVSADAVVYERRFGGNVVVVAINKGASPLELPVVQTALPSGSYADYLGGLLDGGELRAGLPLRMAPHSVGVWQAASRTATPLIGSIGPLRGQPQLPVTIAGSGFGEKPGRVRFDDSAAHVLSWRDHAITVRVPQRAAGPANVRVENADGSHSNDVAFTVVRARLIPVTFTVTNAPALATGDGLYVTGDAIELGNGKTNAAVAGGPFLCPRAPECFLDISLPADERVTYWYFVLDRDGRVRWREPAGHTYTVPSSGTGRTRVSANR